MTTPKRIAPLGIFAAQITKGKGQCTFDRFKAAVEPATATATATATARLRERESREAEKVESVEEKERGYWLLLSLSRMLGFFFKSLCGTLSFTYYNILFFST